MNDRAKRELRRLPIAERSHAVIAANEAVWGAVDPDEGDAPEDIQDKDLALSESVGELYEAFHADPALCDGLVEFCLATIRAAGLVETEASLRTLLRDAQAQGD